MPYVQLIAYHTAVVMGTDVDQPRSAKSVTVDEQVCGLVCHGRPACGVILIA
jgi:hypothetical protein